MTEQIEQKRFNINVKILPSTDQKLEEIMARTYRNKGAVIDWLVAEKFSELTTRETATQVTQPTPQE